MYYTGVQIAPCDGAFFLGERTRLGMPDHSHMSGTEMAQPIMTRLG